MGGGCGLGRLLGGFGGGELLRFGRRLAVSFRCCGGIRQQTELFAQFVFDLAANVGVFLQENPRIFAALAEAFVLVRNPGAGFFEQAFGDAEINQIAFARDAFAVDDVEFGFAERRGDFVLYDFARVREPTTRSPSLMA